MGRKVYLVFKKSDFGGDDLFNVFKGSFKECKSICSQLKVSAFVSSKDDIDKIVFTNKSFSREL